MGSTRMGAAGGDVAGSERDEREHYSDEREGKRVGGADTEENFRYQAS